MLSNFKFSNKLGNSNSLIESNEIQISGIPASSIVKVIVENGKILVGKNASGTTRVTTIDLIISKDDVLYIKAIVENITSTTNVRVSIVVDNIVYETIWTVFVKLPSLPAMHASRKEFTLAVTPSNRLFMLGGKDQNDNLFTKSEWFDLSTRTWQIEEDIPSMYNLSYNTTLAVANPNILIKFFGNNIFIYIVGGEDVNGNNNGIYYQGADTPYVNYLMWMKGNLPISGKMHIAEHSYVAFDGNTQLYSIDISKYYGASIELSNLANKLLPVARNDFTLSVLHGKLYVIGGTRTVDNTLISEIHISPLNSTSWITGKITLQVPRKKHFTLKFNGKLYVVGGIDNSGNVVDTIEIIEEQVQNDFSIKYVRKISSIKFPFIGIPHSIVNVGEYVYIAYNNNPNIDVFSLWGVDDEFAKVSIGTDTSPASMLVPKMGANTVTDSLGNIYAVGGDLSNAINQGEASCFVEKYDVSLNKWTFVAPFKKPRAYPLVLIDKNDKIYVVGGRDPYRQVITEEVIEVYNPATNTWSELNTAIPGVYTWQRTQIAYNQYSNILYIAGLQQLDGANDVSKVVLIINLENDTSELLYDDTGLPIAVRNHAVVVTPSALYVIGGEEEDGVDSTGNKKFKTTSIIQKYAQTLDPDTNMYTWKWSTPTQTLSILKRPCAVANIYDPQERVFMFDLYGLTLGTAVVRSFTENKIYSFDVGVPPTPYFPYVHTFNNINSVYGFTGNKDSELQVIYFPNTSDSPYVAHARAESVKSILPREVKSLSFSSTNNSLYITGGVIYKSGFYEAQMPTNIVEQYDNGALTVSSATPITSNSFDPLVLPNARVSFAAIIGNDNKLYVVNGKSDIGPATLTNTLRTVDVFNFNTFKWEIGSPTNSPRVSHGIGIDHTGKVFIFGGVQGHQYQTAPPPEKLSNNEWYTSSELTVDIQPNIDWTSTVADNKIYWMLFANSEIKEYDLVTQVTSTKATLTTLKYYSTINVLNGKLYIIGGIYNFVIDGTIKCLDLTTNALTDSGTLKVPRKNHSTIVFDNKIYIFGGEDSSGTKLSSIEVFDGQQSVLIGKQLPYATSKQVTVNNQDVVYLIPENNKKIETFSVFNGKVYDLLNFAFEISDFNEVNEEIISESIKIIGIFTSSTINISVTNGEVSLNNSSFASSHTITPHPSGFLFLKAKTITDAELDKTKTVSISITVDSRVYTSSWTVSTRPVNSIRGFTKKRLGHRIINGPDNKIYVIGGVDSYGVFIKGVERYDPIAKQWENVGFLNYERQGFEVTVSPQKQIWIFGGVSPTSPTNAVQSAEYFDSLTSTWILNPSGQVQFYGTITAYVKYEGFLLYYHDKSTLPALHRVPLINTTPTSNITFTNESYVTWASGRVGCTINILNGVLYRIGGNLTGYTDFIESYTFDRNNVDWKKITKLNVPRWGHSTLQYNGKLYIFGGTNATTPNISIVEIFDGTTCVTSSKSFTFRDLPHSIINVGNTVFITYDNKKAVINLSLSDFDIASTYSPGNTNPAPMRIPRGNFGCVSDTSGNIFVIGGVSFPKNYLELKQGTNDGSPINNELGRNYLSKNKFFASTTAEKYNPSTNTWTLLPPFKIPRSNCVVEIGTDNKIYVIGGYNTENAYYEPSIEVYDPTTNTWDFHEVVITNLFDYSIIKYHKPTNEVFVIGGVIFNSNNNTSAIPATPAEQIGNDNVYLGFTSYNLTSKQSTPVTILNNKHPFIKEVNGVNTYIYGQQTLLEFPNFYFIGGYHNTGTLITASDTIFKLNLETHEVTISNLHTARSNFSTIIHNNDLFSIGGTNGPLYNSLLDTIEISNASTPTSFVMPSGNRAYCSSVVDSSNKLYVYGNRVPYYRDDLINSNINKIDVFDISTKQWVRTLSINTRRYSGKIIADNSGKVYQLGGFTVQSVRSPFAPSSSNTYIALCKPVATVQKLGSIPSTSSLLLPPLLNVARYDFACVVDSTNKIYVIGGTGINNEILSSVECYDPRFNTWTLTAPLSKARTGCKAVIDTNNNIYVVGGTSKFDKSLTADFVKEVEKYDGSNWVSFGELTQPRINHEVQINKNTNTFYVFGESTYKTEKCVIGTSPTWTIVTSQYIGEISSSVIDSNGNIYATSNSTAGNVSLQKFDTSTDTWSTLPDTETLPLSLTSIITTSNKIYAFGGKDSISTNVVSFAKWVDTTKANETWHDATNMPTGPRIQHSTVIDNSGSIYVLGGKSSESSTTNVDVVDVLDTATNLWTTANKLKKPRTYSQTVVIPGSIFNIGGILADGTITSFIERFDPTLKKWVNVVDDVPTDDTTDDEGDETPTTGYNHNITSLIPVPDTQRDSVYLYNNISPSNTLNYPTGTSTPVATVVGTYNNTSYISVPTVVDQSSSWGMSNTPTIGINAAQPTSQKVVTASNSRVAYSYGEPTSVQMVSIDEKIRSAFNLTEKKAWNIS
jgi:N-acetylneuraminic acid mutarotase